MGKITFIEHDSTEHIAEFESGYSLMQVAVNNAVPGIDGECGGECAYGTCHVLVTDEWLGTTGDIHDAEAQLLSITPERADTSRSAAQTRHTEGRGG